MVSMSSFHVMITRGQYKGRVGIVNLPGITGRKRFERKKFGPAKKFNVRLLGEYNGVTVQTINVILSRNSLRIALAEEITGAINEPPSYGNDGIGAMNYER